MAARLARAEGRLVVVSAPSGYGKTTSIASWTTAGPKAVAWLVLDVDDNDPDALLTALSAALETVTDFESDRLPPVQGSTHQYSTVVAPKLGRLVGRCTIPFVLVLDEVHLIDDIATLDLLTALVGNVPARSTIVLVGRAEPDLPLARLRANRQVIDVTAADLALDLEAAQDLFRTMGISVDTDDAQALVTATEGWPVGLRVAALALRGDDDVASLTGRRLGHDENLAGYVSEEWLRGLGHDDLDFLLQVSWLDHLSTTFCNDVLERQDSAERLDRLHASRSLVIPLGRHGTTYRMHRLLRSVLLAESERRFPERRRVVERRSSEWCERNGEIDAAVQYALRAGDTARAEHLVAAHTADYVTSGRHPVVRRWIDAFPRSYVLGSGPLCLMSAAASAGLAEADTTSTWLAFAERAARDDGDEQLLDACAALGALTATSIDEEGLAAAAHAHASLPPGAWHALSAVGYGQLLFAVGDHERAIQLFTDAAAEAHVARAITLEVHSRSSLAVAHWESGDSRRASQSARQARSIVSQHRFDDLPTLFLATAMSALVEAVAGNLSSARADIALTRRNLAFVSSVATWANLQARFALARASLLLGERVGAQTLTDEAEALLREAPTLVTSKEQLTGILDQLQVTKTALPTGPSSLTTAELRVLHYLPTNLTLSEIARRLYISRNTAKSHTAAMYRKLGVRTRGQAVAVARSVGLLTVGVDTDTW